MFFLGSRDTHGARQDADDIGGRLARDRRDYRDLRLLETSLALRRF
jgi:hypothetical protein